VADIVLDVSAEDLFADLTKCTANYAEGTDFLSESVRSDAKNVEALEG